MPLAVREAQKMWVWVKTRCVFFTPWSRVPDNLVFQIENCCVFLMFFALNMCVSVTTTLFHRVSCIHKLCIQKTLQWPSKTHKLISNITPMEKETNIFPTAFWMKCFFKLEKKTVSSRVCFTTNSLNDDTTRNLGSKGLGDVPGRKWMGQRWWGLLGWFHPNIWVFPKIGVPQNAWFIMENPMNKWMIWGKSHYFRKHPYIPLISNSWWPDDHHWSVHTWEVNEVWSVPKVGALPPGSVARNWGRVVGKESGLHQESTERETGSVCPLVMSWVSTQFLFLLWLWQTPSDGSSTWNSIHEPFLLM